jgi:hypothetical protein
MSMERKKYSIQLVPLAPVFLHLKHLVNQLAF